MSIIEKLSLHKYKHLAVIKRAGGLRAVSPSADHVS